MKTILALLFCLMFSAPALACPAGDSTTIETYRVRERVRTRSRVVRRRVTRTVEEYVAPRRVIRERIIIRTYED